jgi:hypothetical protein
MVVLLLCGGSTGDVVHATGPYKNNNNNPPTPRDAKRSRRRKDRHARDPPVSSVLVQSKGSDSVTHDTTFCRTEDEDGGGEELESLTYGSRHDGSSVSPLPPIVEHDGSSDGSLTEEDDEDLQLLLIPKAVDRNDYLQSNQGATPSSSSLMPVMELLVRTVLDDPTVPLSKSSCFDAVLKCGKDRAEIHRLRQQISRNNRSSRHPPRLHWWEKAPCTTKCGTCRRCGPSGMARWRRSCGSDSPFSGAGVLRRCRARTMTSRRRKSAFRTICIAATTPASFPSTRKGTP